MGPIQPDDPAAKGPVTESLDTISVASDARDRLTALQQAILGIEAANFVGLENVFAQHLFQEFYTAEQISSIVEYLRTNWFSETGWWPSSQPIAPVYAQGLVQTLRASLSIVGTPLPIDSYWILGQEQVKLITLVSPRQVTLLICTPTPTEFTPSGQLSHPCEVWVTCRRAGRTEQEINPATGAPVAGTPALRVRTFRLQTRSRRRS
jgi:hypothetical protein